MTSTFARTLTSALVAAAAIGGLAVGTAGTASADPQHPITGRTSHFTVKNYTGGPVEFLYYDATKDPAKAGPVLGYIAEPGREMQFDVDNWALGGHQTEAVFSTLHGKHTWNVNMRADAVNTFVMCSSNSACSPNYFSLGTDVVLY